MATAGHGTAPAAAVTAPRGYAGFTEATAPRHLVVPATASVPLIVKLRESAYRPPAFVMGAHGAHAVMEGDCAPSYLEVWLAPLAAYRLLGLPMDAIGGQTVDLTDLLGKVGLRPKTAARLVRFDRVWRRLEQDRSLDWGQVAADAGYADQAHLIRDFRQFTGTTPTDFLASTRAARRDGEDEVNSVQDAVAISS